MRWPKLISKVTITWAIICVVIYSLLWNLSLLREVSNAYKNMSIIALILSFVIYIESARIYLNKMQKGDSTKTEAIKSFAAISVGVTPLVPIILFLTLWLLAKGLDIIGITFLYGNAEEGGWLFIMLPAAQFIIAIVAIIIFWFCTALFRQHGLKKTESKES